MNKKIFVITEYTNDYESFTQGTYELLSGAKNLQNQAKSEFNCDFEISAIVLNSNNENKDFENLARYGADRIIHLEQEHFKNYNYKYFSCALNVLFKEKRPDIVLYSATELARELAPLVSSKLRTGLTADCTEISLVKEKGEIKLASTRPTFGGALMATILSKSNPQCATIREGAIKAIAQEEYKFEIERFDLDKEFCSTSILKMLEFIKNAHQEGELSKAKIILAGGMGLKNKENFEKLKKISEKLNVGLGASRALVSKSIAPQNIQIGQTGLSVAPEIYITFGISGAISHLVGINNAKKIIAINTDSNAPIFSNCDYKIVADCNKIIDEMLTILN